MNHPGVSLMREMSIRGIGFHAVAKATDLTVEEVAEIVRGAKDIDDKIAFGLQNLFGMWGGHWTNHQRMYDALLNATRTEGER